MKKEFTITMKKEFTINYQKQWSDDGTVYDQTINITTETFNKLLDILQAENTIIKIMHKEQNSIDGDDCMKNLYLKTPLSYSENKIYVYMNLTQRDFFNKFLKLKLKDRNTCFCIID